MTGRIPKRTARPGMDEYGRIPLHYAAIAGDLSDIARELSAGADLDMQDDHGMTPLHFAVQEAHLGAVSALLEAGANPNLYDVHGNGPLWIAVLNARGGFEILKALLQAGADGAHKNNYGRSPRDMARTIGHGLEELFEHIC